jgi:PIN domain nuclease of toxin-antitoxin system
MTYLLDTHTFIWWAVEPERLPEHVLATLQIGDSSVFLSIVSIWEMQIKVQIGKLQLPRPLPELIFEQQTRNHIELLTIEPAHIYALEYLPFHHNDPFDRLLVAQALISQFTLISRDPQLSSYPITLFW